MNIDVTFPGGQVVEAQVAGHVVRTDQRQKHGGGDSASTPFNLFLASIATCMGFYAMRFCQKRELETEGLCLTLETVEDPESKMIRTIHAKLELPAGFPPKYVQAIERSMDQCAVKKHMFEPPDFEMQTEIAPGVPHLVS